MPFEYLIEDCGRVKMAGGTFSTYYDLAGDLVGNENPSVDALVDANRNFKNIRKQPPFDLLLAFFPDDYANIQYRLRGAGAYRHLRMDQGPGGNFTRFDLGRDADLHYEVTGDKGFAMPEVLIEEQLAIGAYPQLSVLRDKIQKAFEKNDYRTTAVLVNKFRFMAAEQGLALHDGTHVGSKSGFFFIRPAATDRNVQFPIDKIPQLRAKIDEALNKSLSLAAYTKENLSERMNFERAVAEAEKKYREQGGKEYQGQGLLYFQPDCFVDNQGNIEVEKINMPDVGLFMTMLNRPSNDNLQRVAAANIELKNRLKSAAATFLQNDKVVLITREEVINCRSDSLELLEIKALQQMLQSIGKEVQIKTPADYESIDKKQDVLLLNADSRDKHFGKFAEHIVRRGINCLADPLVYYFKDRATTLKTIQVPSKYMDQFMQLIKPKDITARNAENIYNRLQYIMKRFDMSEDIVYAKVSGYNMPIPAFKYSLHSFGQIYKAYEKSAARNKMVELSAVPLNQDNAVFYGQGKPRLAAFRFMCRKER